MKILFTLLLLSSLAMKAQVIQIEEMIEGRNGHTASYVNMEGGTPGALICGGSDGLNVLESAEWYNGQSDTWSPLSSMSNARVDHTATSYENGNYVLVAGGWNGFSENYSSTEIFNALTSEWSDGPEMSSGRSSHVAAFMEDVNGVDYILVTGGFDGISEIASCERLNLNTMQWESAGNMNMGRSSHTLTKLNDGRFLVTGGFNAVEGFQLSTCEVYDPISNEWTSVDDMADTRDHHAAVLLNDGSVMVAGGRRFNPDLNLFEGMTECEIYNPTTDSWVQGADLPEPQNYHQLIYIVGPYYLLPGGVDNTGIDVDITYSLSTEYNQSSSSWIESTDTVYPEGRFKYAMVTIPEGILVCGGENGDSTGELYTSFLTTAELAEDALVFYPNPAHDQVYIQNNDFNRVRIYGLEGDLCYEAKLTHNTSLDLSAYARGIYTIQFVGTKEVFTQKLILE
jgi:Secretion system C-terminal sorting domain/Kelch motif/Galactose oxidase, central domain